jgi:AAA domain, putative AbiEii toxin, Type IV TA system/AAA ATPase domain
MTIERVEIENLRGIREGRVEGLSPLSILVGPNNAGKSTVLEALWCVGAGANAELMYRTLLRRGGPALHALEHVKFDGSKPAAIRVFGPGEQRCTVLLERPKSRNGDRLREATEQGLTEPMMPAQVTWDFSWAGKAESGVTLTFVDRARKFASPFALEGTPAIPWKGGLVDVEAVRDPGALEDAYSNLEKQRRVAEVVRALKRAMPTLTDLRILKVDDDFVLHAICGDEPPIPAYLAGDGFKRFLEVAAQVYAAGAGGVVLLEEPESFQHPRYLGELASVLHDAASRGTQVILSTHSMELIDLLLGDGSDARANSPTVHRLRLLDHVLHAAAVSAENARIARHELAQDLRA